MFKESLEYFRGDELAATVFMTKYAYKGEKTPNDMHRRMSDAIAKVEHKYAKELTKEQLNSLSKYGLKLYYLFSKMNEKQISDEVFEWIKEFKYIVPGGSIMAGLGTDQLASLANCFVIDYPKDNMGSIFDTAKHMAYLSMRRGGVGTCLDYLRPNGSSVSNAAKTSSGPVSFMNLYSSVITTVGQNGRRGALMLAMSDRHPDIAEFVTSKNDLSKISGANISVKLSKKLLEAAEYDEDWITSFPINFDGIEDAIEATNILSKDVEYNKLIKCNDSKGKTAYLKKISAKELWNTIIQSAWKTAEPGILLWDNHMKYDPSAVYERLKPISTNPCVTGDTVILTRDGYRRIDSLVGRETEIWNGYEWSKVTPRITGYNQEIMVVKFSDGNTLKVTPYHKFILKDLTRVEAKDLKIGDALIKCKFPITEELCNTNIDVYNSATIQFNKGINTVDVSETSSVMNRIDWIQAFMDYFGCSKKNCILMYNKNEKFLHNVKYLLNSLGCNPKIKRDLDNYILIIYGRDLFNLSKLGLKVNSKINAKKKIPFIKVVSIEKQDHLEDKVYCFTEPKNHSGIFNGVITAQCGEQPLADKDSCRLSHLNLYSFVKNPFTEKAEIDYDLLYEMAYKQVYFLDDIIDIEVEHIQRIINKSDVQSEKDMWSKVQEIAKLGRRIGCGITGLGDCIAAMGESFPSSDYLIEKIMSVKLQAELDATIDLSIVRGAFELYDNSLEFSSIGIGRNDFYKFISETFPGQTSRMKLYGRRNVSVSTIAPVGSGSILTQTTSGIEPLFKGIYKRRRKVNDGEKYDFIDPYTNQKFQEFIVAHPKLKEYCSIVLGKNFDDLNEKEKYEVFKKSPYYGNEAGDIPWSKRLEIQAIATKYTTSAISTTINLVEDEPLSTVENIYRHAYALGLKGVTCYRENSRSGVLVDAKKQNNILGDRHAPKRPQILDARIHTMSANGKKYVCAIGFLNNAPYEIFLSWDNGLEKLPDNGKIVKIKSGYYQLQDNDGNVIIDNFSDLGDGDLEMITRLLSISMRSNVGYNFLVDQLSRGKGDITHFSKILARVLKKYVKDYEKSGETCPECGSKLIYQNGCTQCPSCSYSKCS